VPYILEDHRLIDEWESHGICARMARKANPEFVLAGVVKRAYLDYGEHLTDENIWREIASLKRDVAALRHEVEAARSHNVIVRGKRDGK
jgi:hypothetical protein